MFSGSLTWKNKKNVFSHIDGSQIKKSSWLVNEMCREWSNLSFKQLKLHLELGNWLKIGWKLKKSKFGDALLLLLWVKISNLKIFHGNGLHLGGRVLEILYLNAETEPWRLADPKITGFENRIILLKIDLKWPKNRWRWFFLTMVSI